MGRWKVVTREDLVTRDLEFLRESSEFSGILGAAFSGVKIAFFCHLLRWGDGAVVAKGMAKIMSRAKGQKLSGIGVGRRRVRGVGVIWYLHFLSCWSLSHSTSTAEYLLNAAHRHTVKDKIRW